MFGFKFKFTRNRFSRNVHSCFFVRFIKQKCFPSRGSESKLKCSTLFTRFTKQACLKANIKHSWTFEHARISIFPSHILFPSCSESDLVWVGNFSQQNLCWTKAKGCQQIAFCEFAVLYVTIFKFISRRVESPQQRTRAINYFDLLKCRKLSAA